MILLSQIIQSVTASSFRFPDLFFNKSLHILFLREVKLAFRNKEIIVHAGQGIFHQRLVSLGTEEDADGRTVSHCHHVHFIPGYIGIELADVLVVEPFELQFDQDVTFENSVVEDEVHKVVGIAD